MSGSGHAVPALVRVHTDSCALAAAAADASTAVIAEALGRRGRCSIALAGGETPRALYTHLATTYRDRIDWERVHLFWGDERVVAPGDARSNFRMAWETLLQYVPCPASNVHPMSGGDPDPAAAAARYGEQLTRLLDGEPACANRSPTFDLVLLGIGTDGHTASIFPGSPALAATAPPAMAVTTPADPPRRLTLTMPVLVAARALFVLAAGATKAQAVAAALSPATNPQVVPAAALRAAGARVTWWIDRTAAAGIDAGRIT